MRTTIGKALFAALREGDKSTEKERAHARRWLAGTTRPYDGCPDFKIVIRPDDKGQWWAVLAYGVLGYSAADSNALVKVRVAL